MFETLKLSGGGDHLGRAEDLCASDCEFLGYILKSSEEELRAEPSQRLGLVIKLRAVGMLAEGIRPIYASGECEIDLARRELRILGLPSPVGGRAFEFVEVLAKSAGELVTKDELMGRVWPGAIVMDGTLNVHAATVRKARVGLSRR